MKHEASSWPYCEKLLFISCCQGILSFFFFYISLVSYSHYIGTSQPIHGDDSSFRVKPLKSPLNIYCRSKTKNVAMIEMLTDFIYFSVVSRDWQTVWPWGAREGRGEARLSLPCCKPPWSTVSSLGLDGSLHLPAETGCAGVPVPSLLSLQDMWSFFKLWTATARGLGNMSPLR